MNTLNSLRHHALFCATAALALFGAAATTQAQNIVSASGPATLVTGKNITLPPVGTVANVGSLPMNMILTPDGKFAISTDMGFRQSLHALSTTTGKDAGSLEFGPDKVGNGYFGPDGLYYGLAAKSNSDGTSTIYASEGTQYSTSSAKPTPPNTGSVAVVNVSPTGALSLIKKIVLKNPGDFPAGVALDSRGYLYVAINQSYGNGAVNAITTPGSLAIIDTNTGNEVGRYSFVEPVSTLNIPGATIPFSPTNFPLSVAALNDGSKVYVSSQRDGAVYAVNCTDPSKPTASATLTTGQHPISLLLNKAQTKLYVANAHSETVSVVNTATNATATILMQPTGTRGLAGVTPTGLGLTQDESRLYVSLGDINAVGVVDTATSTVVGYIPVGWYPTAVVASPVKPILLVANAKGTQTRYPNPGYKQFEFAGQYDLNQIEGNVETIRVPGSSQLAAYTQMTLANNKVGAIANPAPNPLASIGLSSGKIKHVFYIVKENRTYDQVLGDLPAGNGDPTLAIFGKNVTPNLHALASRFVLLDNFFDCGEASGDGWPWSTQGHANEAVIKNLPYNYSGRGRNYDFEGQNNAYPVGGFPVLDPYGVPLVPNSPFKDKTTGIAPAITDVSLSPGGHIWDNAQKNINLSGTGLTTKYRNYGFFAVFGDNVSIPDNYPTDLGLRPAGYIPTSGAAAADLSKAGVTDIDFRRYDGAYADSDGPAAAGSLYPTATYGHYNAPSRFAEWNREFTEMLKADPSGSTVPAFETVRFMHDHTQGVFPGGHLPAAEVADNDYSVGQFVEAVSKSSIWNSSAIFIIEDDAQDGPDHVDGHRSTCFVISPYIKKSVVDSTFYNTDSVFKTMELLLNMPPMSQYDAVANPILAFDTAPNNGGVYAAILPDKAILSGVAPSAATAGVLRPLMKLSAKMDFTHPDSAPSGLLNEVIWKSVKGMNSKMPAIRHSVQIGKTAKPAAKSARKDSDD